MCCNLPRTDPSSEPQRTLGSINQTFAICSCNQQTLLYLQHPKYPRGVPPLLMLMLLCKSLLPKTLSQSHGAVPGACKFKVLSSTSEQSSQTLYYRSITEFPALPGSSKRALCGRDSQRHRITINIHVPLTLEQAMKACFLQQIIKQGETSDLLRPAASGMSPGAEGTETGVITRHFF